MRLFSKAIQFLPAIRVHVWGGLGSQLFGLITANRLQIKWPHRRVHLVFHSSGVTQRFLELDLNLIPNFKITQKLDFRNYKIQDYFMKGERKKQTINFKRILKLTLLHFGVLRTLDTNSDYSNLRPWLLSVRGHYTGIKLRSGEVAMIIQAIGLNHSISYKYSERICVHLRLGDLLHLENKSHISLSRIKSIPEMNNIDSQVFVFSDSETDVVENLWKSEIPFGSCKFLALDVQQTIAECVASRIFVGTNSKISFWIATFRLALKVGGNTYLPRELESYVDDAMAELVDSMSIISY